MVVSICPNVIYIPGTNELLFTIDNTIVERSAFMVEIYKMDLQKIPIKLYSKEITSEQLDKYIQKLDEYIHSNKSKWSTKNMRKNKHKKIVDKIFK